VFDGITERKWFDISTDEVPTRPMIIGSEHYKAKPKRCHDAMVSIGYLKADAI
jgi:hypothetical protein